MKHAKIARLTAGEPKITFEEMLIAIGDSLSDLAGSDNGEDWEDEDDEETKQGRRSDDDEPGWVMGTITNTVQQCMERFRQKQIKLDELTHLGCEDAAKYFCVRNERYGTSKLRVLAIVQPQTDDDAAAHAVTTFGELIKSLEIVPGISQMPQGTSRPGSTRIRLGSVMPQLNTSICGFEPTTEHDTSPLLKAKPVEPVSLYHCI